MFPSLRAALTLTFASLLSGAGAPASVRADEWITPPAQFLAANYLRSPSAPVRTHDVILEVPRGGGVKAKPVLVLSCGDAALDQVAVRFVTTVMERSTKLKARGDAAALRFQIRLAPAKLDPKDLPMRFQRSDKTIKAGRAFDMPPPTRLAFGTLYADGIKDGSIRLRFASNGGTPDEAVMIKSTTATNVDSAILMWSLANALGRPTPGGKPIEVTIPMGFKDGERASGPGEAVRPSNFPTNQRTFP